MTAVREPGSVLTAIHDFQTKVNPSTPRSDPHVSSPRNINALSNIGDEKRQMYELKAVIFI